jgi:hypothetical protein
LLLTHLDHRVSVEHKKIGDRRRKVVAPARLVLPQRDAVGISAWLSRYSDHHSVFCRCGAAADHTNGKADFELTQDN